jgi:hypothetical protein
VKKLAGVSTDSCGGLLAVDLTTHSVDSNFADHGKYQRRYLISYTMIVVYFLRHWIKGWVVESEKSAGHKYDGKTAMFSPVMDLKEMEIMIQDIEKDQCHRIDKTYLAIHNKLLAVAAIIWTAWLNRTQKGGLSKLQYCVAAICRNLECKEIEQ